MPGTVVLGAQWGDEGKGKITDLLSADADIVVRYAGGPNAGHTIVVGEHTLKLHHIPSGILYPHVTCILGNGMVVDPQGLLDEMDRLAGDGIDISRLRISNRTHVIMPYHRLLDSASEAERGTNAIGTTGRGIGPTYADKAARRGLRIHQLADIETAEDEIRQACAAANRQLEQHAGRPAVNAEDLLVQCCTWSKRLRPHIADTGLLLHRALQEKKRVLFEGAQGILLDIDHGTYPFVTSASTGVGGALTGTGVGPQALNRIVGVTKAYTTRVGAGPFPTELHDAAGDRLGEQGREFGTTTGRRRRTGWLDGVALRYAARVNGLTELALTKLDVLAGFERIPICTAYRHDAALVEDFPPVASALAECQPVYAELPGWSDDISAVRSFDQLPAAAQRYVQFVEDLASVPITTISVGPDRSQTLIRRPTRHR